MNQLASKSRLKSLYYKLKNEMDGYYSQKTPPFENAHYVPL